VLQKIRRGDRDVEVSVPDIGRWAGRTPVLIDDIISTARTMVRAAERVRQASPRAPVCVGVHAVFAQNAYRELLDAGAAAVVTTNTIAHETNAIDLSAALAAIAAEIMPSPGRKPSHA
jgi:ribose-phosphate pyrophosphokinase